MELRHLAAYGITQLLDQVKQNVEHLLGVYLRFNKIEIIGEDLQGYLQRMKLERRHFINSFDASEVLGLTVSYLYSG